MTQFDEIARGRKEIMEFLRIEDWGTVRSWQRKHSLPIRRLPNKQPFIIRSEIILWMKQFSDSKMKK
jgi:hypothetical protein